MMLKRAQRKNMKGSPAFKTKQNILIECNTMQSVVQQI